MMQGKGDSTRTKSLVIQWGWNLADTWVALIVAVLIRIGVTGGKENAQADG